MRMVHIHCAEIVFRQLNVKDRKRDLWLMYIENINSPRDLKKLNYEQCNILAKEIREAIIRTTSKKGGHLASNLGCVELTLALHYVFSFPEDKLVFDTSHQCYAHKILTGRKSAFTEERLYLDYTGYTNPKESEYDLFELGHTSTSISMSCGLAKARDLANGRENVIALIGDGALGGGQALEGLNFVGGELKSNFIIVLNDNDASIAENHGGIYTNLKILRETKGKAQSNIFKSFGLDYVFIEDGHNIEELIKVFSDVKDSSKPIVVHVCTTKGKGYESAELQKENSHWVKKFDIKEGIKQVPVTTERYDYIIRDCLIKKMKRDSMVMAVVAAVPNALAFDRRTRVELGKQYVDVGIMEEHAISMMAGIVKNGGKPVFSTRSTFIQRAYDQISHELGINKLAATIILVNASIYAPTDKTHMGLFDIPMISNIPNIVFLAPTNKQEYLAMFEWSIDQNEYPVIIRAPRNGVFNAKYEVTSNYENINTYQWNIHGEQIAVIAAGDFYQLGETLVEKIAKDLNISASLINPRFISGIDKGMLDEISKKHSVIITLEDGIIEGGFGQRIASFYGNYNVKVMNYGFKKEFFDSYDTNSVLKENGIDADMILSDIRKIKDW